MDVVVVVDEMAMVIISQTKGKAYGGKGEVALRCCYHIEQATLAACARGKIIKLSSFQQKQMQVLAAKIMPGRPPPAPKLVFSVTVEVAKKLRSRKKSK